MPKSRLSNNSSNHYDDNELLIPNHRIDEKKSVEPNVNHHKSVSSNKSYGGDSILKSSTSQHASTTTPTTNRSSTRSNSTKASRPVSSTASATSKPNTILSLEDRDIIVIDNHDYKESTSSENTVIVVEKPRKLHKSVDVDLAELLAESNWPDSAGDMALALNNSRSNSGAQYSFSSGSTSTSNSSISCQQSGGSSLSERNRSKNPIAHFGHARVKRNLSNNLNNFVTTGNLINLDSDGSSASGSYELNSSKYTETFLLIKKTPKQRFSKK